MSQVNQLQRPRCAPRPVRTDIWGILPLLHGHRQFMSTHFLVLFAVPSPEQSVVLHLPTGVHFLHVFTSYLWFSLHQMFRTKVGRYFPYIHFLPSPWGMQTHSCSRFWQGGFTLICIDGAKEPKNQTLSRNVEDIALALLSPCTLNRHNLMLLVSIV